MKRGSGGQFRAEWCKLREQGLTVQDRRKLIERPPFLIPLPTTVYVYVDTLYEPTPTQIHSAHVVYTRQPRGSTHIFKRHSSAVVSPFISSLDP